MKSKNIFRIRRTIYVYTHWLFDCSWCGAKQVPHATDGCNIYCYRCGY